MSTYYIPPKKPHELYPMPTTKSVKIGDKVRVYSYGSFSLKDCPEGTSHLEFSTKSGYDNDVDIYVEFYKVVPYEGKELDKIKADHKKMCDDHEIAMEKWREDMKVHNKKVNDEKDAEELKTYERLKKKYA